MCGIVLHPAFNHVIMPILYMVCLATFMVDNGDTPSYDYHYVHTIMMSYALALYEIMENVLTTNFLLKQFFFILPIFMLPTTTNRLQYSIAWG